MFIWQGTFLNSQCSPKWSPVSWNVTVWPTNSSSEYVSVEFKCFALGLIPRIFSNCPPLIVVYTYIDIAVPLWQGKIIISSRHFQLSFTCTQIINKSKMKFTNLFYWKSSLRSAIPDLFGNLALFLQGLRYWLLRHFLAVNKIHST